MMMHHYTKFGYKTKILLTVQKYLLDKARHTASQTDRWKQIFQYASLFQYASPLPNFLRLGGRGV